MTRKRKTPPLITHFGILPRDMIIEIIKYDDRFYLSKNGEIVSRFARKDPRYVLLARIPKINYVWNYYYLRGTVISYIISMVFLSKNKRHLFSLEYYLDHDEDSPFRKVILSNKLAICRYGASPMYKYTCFI